MAIYDYYIHYQGKELEENRIPVRDLAPSLFALSESFQAIQKVINPTEAPLSLDIKATSKGSFIVDLVLASGPDLLPHLLDEAVNFLSGNMSTAVTNLAGYVGIFGGVIALIKKIGNKKLRTKEEKADGKIELTLEDGSKISVDKKILDVYKNIEFRKQIHEFVKPLSNNGIENIECYHEKSKKTSISKEEYTNFEVPEINETDLKSSVSEVYLQIINVAFEHGKWKFSNGANQFFSEIKDKNFLNRVKKNEETFASSDTLKVRLETSQKIDKKGMLKSEYTILKVVDHIKAPQEIPLNFEEEKSKK